MNNRTAKLIRRHCMVTGASKKQYRRMKRAWNRLGQKQRSQVRQLGAKELLSKPTKQNHE